MIFKKSILFFGAFALMSWNAMAQSDVPVEIMKGKRTYLKKTMILPQSSSYWKIEQNQAVSGVPLRMKGKLYEKGLGVHAPSNLIYKLPPKAHYFYVVPGGDDAHHGKISMSIKVDNVEVFSSGVFDSQSQKYMPKLHAIDVSGATFLTLIVDDIGDKGGDHADWGEAFFVEGKKEFKPKNPELAKKFFEEDDSDLEGKKVYLVKELATTVDSYWKVLNNEGIEGGRISIEGRKYEKGIGLHAPSKLVFPIEANYKTFVVTPGANDSNGGLIRMRIQVDGNEVFNSGPIRRSNQEPQRLQIDVKGKKELTLLVDEEDGDRGGDHASWANAYFLIDDGSK
ncbi:NPCBM/NEW2 domain-containing protein [Flammeovirga sp. EKP202]|uniref:NPCBM/NEW2 domain-containing protein n=1 Tax=Flammeovirga sp. EKP202 TaxID=2770592 RepID=UPI00165F04F3|nr:NPCBM/NEW2 domain-containing protein [Flammeovirga sp. EKP202]MBD0403734.1 NPCBM/NEW2 domain-containing protein [Flammeovirga sp. EKP202]